MNKPPPLGQHWLNHPESLQAMVEAADLKPGETVLEIGTGLGYLTDELLQTPARVISLEYDAKLYERNLAKYTARPNGDLELLSGDIRSFNWQSLPAAYKICANIPYYLTANLLRRLTEIDNKPSLAALLMPAAVAGKLSSATKKSLLSVLVQSHYRVELAQKVGRQFFEPPPKIDSQIVILKLSPAFMACSNKQWADLVKLFKLGFSHPRKQLATNLRASSHLEALQIGKMMADLSIPSQARPGELDHGQWWQLFLAFQRLKN